MQAILAVTLPFFALVLLGYLAAWRRVLPESAIPGLNGYVLYFALPCLLLRFGSSMPFAQLLDPVLVGLYGLCALVMVAFTITTTLQRGRPGHGVNLRDAAFGALVAAFPNTGFMGVPLLVALLGERAAGPVIGTILVDMLLTSTLCLAIAQHHASAAGRAARGGRRTDGGLLPVLRSLRGPLTNPMPWSIALGAVIAASGARLPGPLTQVIKMLADSASPVALFTIGAVLARSQYVAALEAHDPMPPRDYLPIVLVKLVVHPLLVLGVGSLAIAMGAPLGRFTLEVMVLVAALPSASNVSVLAERFGADTGRIARIILLTTALAFLSFSAAVAVLR